MNPNSTIAAPSRTVQPPLRHMLVGEIRGRFFVPRYQRGYRWETEDIERLLDDIRDCEGKPYSLQPIVVKLRVQGVSENEREWELIDGQQRLTTLYLIFRYLQQQGGMGEDEGPPYSLDYETRHDSADYLKTLDPNLQDKNIDYHHIFKAYERIGQWFQDKGDTHVQRRERIRIYSYLCDCVRVIWYEAPENPEDNERDSAALFARLNIGRIPLTDAELVKALLLSKSDRAQEVAAQWDMIESDLRDPEIWAFVAGAEATGEYQTHIGLLLDALAPLPKGYPRGRKRPTYHTFETLRRPINEYLNGFWQQVLGMHALIRGWFGEPRLHNKIGFLVATGTGFDELWGLAQREGLKKSQFEQALTQRIRARIAIGESRLRDLTYDNKGDHPKLLNLLLLMNVETVSRSGQRFPFRRHVGKIWSLEHIHAQNTQSLNKKEQWEAWLREHCKALSVLPDSCGLVAEINGLLAEFDIVPNLGARFHGLADRVIGALTIDGMIPEDGLHAIDNLALLSRDDNSRLNNAVFEVKRLRILEIDRKQGGAGDGYIPVCTRNVFLKYYADEDAQQIHFWSRRDREGYFRAIVSALQPYFTPEEPSHESG